MSDIQSYISVICVVIIIFIVSITLLLYAPKSNNFYDINKYPEIKIVSEMLEFIQNDLEVIIKPENKKASSKWLEYPDKSFIKGECKIYPIYIFDKSYTPGRVNCKYTYTVYERLKYLLEDRYHTSPDTNIIKSCFFMKLGKYSSILKQNNWADLANNNLRYIVFLKGYEYSNIDICGVWINGESKHLTNKKMYLCDSSIENSIYNDTEEDLYLLVIDVLRPDKIPKGVSSRKYTDEVYECIKKIK